MNRINFKGFNLKSKDKSYFKPKINKKTVDDEWNWEIKATKPVEQPGIKHETLKVNIDKNWLDYDDFYNNGYNRKLMFYTSGEEKKEVIEKPKLTEKDIVIRTISNEDRKYSEYGHVNHHSHKEYKLVEKHKSTSIKITDNVGGCGVQQLYNWYNSENNENVELVLNKVLKDIENGVGLIMCQVGQDFFDSLFVKALVNNGFTYSSYINYQHGEEYEGRMYMLKIQK